MTWLDERMFSRLPALSLVLVAFAGGCDSPPPAIHGDAKPAALEAREDGRAGAATAGGEAGPPSGPWLPLERDFLHDTENPALSLLQQPAEALSELPPGKEGNHVDWVAALRSGAIAPRTNILPETKVNLLDLDVVMEETAGMPMVLFPHRPHTEWLDCSNCHDRLFVAKRGANPVNMLAILDGRYCGQCHGAVSFPLTQCLRCHSVPRANGPQPDAG